MGAALFPKPIAFAAGEIRKHFWPALGTGVVAILVFTMLVVFAALLSFILIGIPIALALAVAGFIVKVFGRLAVFFLLGESALRAFGSKSVSAMGAVLMGLFVFSLAGFVPVLGFLFTFVMNAVGWGIAIRTKFGSRENWFVKKPSAADVLITARGSLFPWRRRAPRPWRSSRRGASGAARAPRTSRPR